MRYSPKGHKESDMTEQLSMHTSLCQAPERKELKRKGGPEEVRGGSKRREGSGPALEPKGCPSSNLTWSQARQLALALGVIIRYIIMFR